MESKVLKPKEMEETDNGRVETSEILNSLKVNIFKYFLQDPWISFHK